MDATPPRETQHWPGTLRTRGAVRDQSVLPPCSALSCRCFCPNWGVVLREAVDAWAGVLASVLLHKHFRRTGLGQPRGPLRPETDGATRHPRIAIFTAL